MKATIPSFTLQPHHQALREIEREEDQAQMVEVQRARLERLRERFGIEEGLQEEAGDRNLKRGRKIED